MHINEIGRIAHAINIDNGWDVFLPEDWGNEILEVTKLCAHMALIHTEVSEATEAVRKRDKTNFAEELADIVIRTSSVAHGLGIHLESAIAAKMDFNKKRVLRHGGKAI